MRGAKPRYVAGAAGIGLALVVGCAGFALGQSVNGAPAGPANTPNASAPAASAPAATPSPVPLAPASGEAPASGADLRTGFAPDGAAPAASDPATSAAQAAQQAAENQKALDVLESSIGLSQSKIDTLRQQIADMNGDRAKQNAALIAAGQRAKIAEIEVQSMEERLNALADSERAAQGKLDGTNAGISNMLAALEHISLNPPPPLIVDPSDAVSSARGAMLITDIVPQLKAKADEVVAELKQLQGIKADAQKQQDELKANYAVLEEEQLRIATLIQAKKQGIDAANVQLTAQEQEAADMGAKATSLKALIAELTAKFSAVSAAASAASNANPQLPNKTPAAIKTALADTSRTQPAIPFGDARGYLTAPTAGTDVEDFGANDGFGGIAHGVSYATRPDAQVVAPADGWVIYKGPYLNYGQIVILNPGQDYTILLAGLDAVSVDLGQFVLEGEPLGTMGSHTIGHAVATSAGVSQPTLYIEIRKNDRPVDPSGWWASPANTTQSG
ncbi:MAG TPA: peptidoglycan DD-metalloendopeptidase family protein [Devosiaceae bacterium]|nr:peptidoglycan DD-metalloendopeptidase family protein [Devosiaceae bacterium]